MSAAGQPGHAPQTAGPHPPPASARRRSPPPAARGRCAPPLDVLGAHGEELLGQVVLRLLIAEDGLLQALHSRRHGACAAGPTARYDL